MELIKHEEKISVVEYLILLNIFKYQTKEEITISELAIKINREVTNSIFQNVCKNLVSLNIFKFIKSVGSAHLYIINYNKLEDFIRQNYIYQKTKEFVMKADPLMNEL